MKVVKLLSQEPAGICYSTMQRQCAVLNSSLFSISFEFEFDLGGMWYVNDNFNVKC